MSKETNLKRRNFLLRVGVGGAGAAAAVIGGVKLTEQVEDAAAPREKGRRGYQLSEHVRNYYRTTRV